jgi:hypothetical protein
MHKQQARMYEIERVGRKRLSEQVNATNLNTIAGELLEQAGIDVDRQYRTSVTDPLGEKSRYRARAGADVHASPTRADPDRVELSDGSRIVFLLQQREPRPFDVGQISL